MIKFFAKVLRVLSVFLRTAKNIRNVEQFLNYNFPVSENMAPLTIGTLDGECATALRSAVSDASSLDGPIVEIGSLFGHSAFLIAEEKADGQLLFCVDAYKWNPYGLSESRHRELLELNLGHLFRTADTKLISVDNNQVFFRDYDGPPPALVFIDAGHFYPDVKEDIDWAVNAGARIVCGDDFHFEGVRRAVGETFGSSVEVIDGKFWRAKVGS